MSPGSFHPVVQQWFRETLGEPTAAQRRGWESIRSGCHTLIAAPTGSGKTLAAFLSALDDLFRASLDEPLPDEVRVIYVSPLKALSTDIHRNLAVPRRGICALAEKAGLAASSPITAAVRTGDTPNSERAAMLRTPPHILVTTPESLYLLLTSERSRNMLRTARTIIVDEIHAVIGTRRGAHLALSLERLRRLCDRPLLRIGLSATQKPLADVARFLVGGRPPEPCTIVDEGHWRTMDLGVELPRSSLDAVMAHEVWEDYYDRLEALVSAHRTTLVFVNTRRMAERLARHLSDRLGEDAVTAHHGSLSKEKRLDAETRLKTGALKALVATASLELGIDIGHVDLVCQIGSPHRIATLLQRVGRSGHTVSGTPKGRLFPVTRDDLLECAALMRAVRRGELDAILHQEAPLDVLAQQIVAECACREYGETELYDVFRTAAPYRSLSRADFDGVITMAADGFSTRRGRRAALLHRDEVNGRVRGRRGSRLLALTSGGAIPELADYRVVLDPDDTFIGTLNEDFAIESMAGDVFQLGNSSWRVLQVAAGTVRVEDARGVPPNIPFWFGEAPARSDELSEAVSGLRADADVALGRPENGATSVVDWLAAETGIGADAATQVVDYLTEGRRALGVIPSRQTLVLERFFDESGGMQLVLHAPFGSRINKAWGLALRKRFCRQFNFELQAAATEDALLLSLGPQHSFPLADVFRYLHPETTRDVLVQAFLDAPVFKTRWRWNTTVALAVPRSRGGRKVAPQLQRMLADDLMAAVFPDAAACLENIPGDRQIPDHPLVKQTIQDCLQEAMDFDGLRAVLGRIHAGELTLIARDTPEPSVFAHEILNAKPYAFLDDAPLEERRTQAVLTRRAGEMSSAGNLGALDPAAIERVRDEVRPEPVDRHEMHDVLMSAGFVVEEELSAATREHVNELLQERRATPALPPQGARIWVAAERVPELRALIPAIEVQVEPPASRSARVWSPEDALVELLRGRLMFSGPVIAAELVAPLGLRTADADSALLALESQGVVLRGHFSPSRVTRAIEYCDRSLLSRIHRYTLNRLRAEIEPVSIADFMRFLFAWQHLDPATRLTGLDGLREALAGLDGFELAAGAWERTVLPARVDGYDPAMLDMLCLSGEIAWRRLSAPSPESPPPLLVPATPIALFLREHRDAWQPEPPDDPEQALTPAARRVLAVLRQRGASFLPDIATPCDLDMDALRQAIGALVATGLAASDGFSGLRSLLTVPPAAGPRSRRQFTGRWTASSSEPSAARDREEAVQTQAWALLRRYGVVFRRVLTREASAAPWRDLTRVYRRLEARGEIRGGRFVTGVSGEQFALPDAVERLREVRRTPAAGHLVAIGTADPVNLAGVVASGERFRSATRNKLVYRDGIPVAALEGGYIRHLAPLDSSTLEQLSRALARRRPAHIV